MKKILFILLFLSQISFSQSSNEVGVTKGELSVSLSGSATYEIPLTLPPGINGVVPQIGLQYNSQSDNGLAGYGWNISGLSAITRINSTKFHDGKSDPVDFDNLDRFALDGQRLLLKSGTYDSSVSTYVTENFSNVIITAYSTIYPRVGPQYFIVQYPDGTIAHYGNSTDSKSITTWALTYWENPQGINIKYSYTLIDNNLIISSIKYGSKGTLPAVNEILFVYKDRKRIEQAYIYEQNIMKSKILSSIEVKGNGIGFRNYYLEHGLTPLNYEKLIKITEKTGDNSLAYNPTVFEYGDPAATNSGSSNEFFINTDIDDLSIKATTGDFDGDGNSDFIFYNRPGVLSQFTLYKNLKGTINNVGIIKNTGAISEIFATNFLTGNSNTGFKINPEEGWTVITSSDLNHYKFENYLLNENSQIIKDSEKTLELCTRANSSGLDKQMKKFISGDFNGDGLTDIILINGKGNSYFSGNNCFADENSVYFIDLRKDVTVDYAKNVGTLTVPSGFTSSKNINFNNVQVGDFNGDGKSDFIVPTGQNLYVYTLNDSNTAIILLEEFSMYLPNINELFLGDFNGDGKSDLVIPVTKNQDRWDFYISNQKKFVKIANKSIGVEYLTRYDTNIITENKQGPYDPPIPIIERKITTETIFIVKDVNGDGKSDILCQNYKQSDYVKYIPDNTYSDIKKPLSRDIIYIANKLVTNVDINFFAPSSTGLYTSKIGAIPLLTSITKGDAFVLDYSYASGNKIYSIAVARNQKTNLLLNSITLGNGVKETISYKSLREEANTNLSIYKPQRGTENYPNLDIITAAPFKVVSKIEMQSATDYKKKLFSYSGAVVNFDGQGFLGFRANLQTDWHNDLTPVISNISKSNINLKGSIVETYKVLGLVEPSSNYTTNDFIQKSIITYNSNPYGFFPFPVNKQFRLQKLKIDNFNGLDGSSSSTTFSYNNYNNPTQSVTTIKNNESLANTVQVTTENYAYYPQYSYLTNYKITDALQKKTISTKIFPSNEVTTSEETFSYTNGNLISQVLRKGHLTDYIKEDNLFDIYGNITKKTITPMGSSTLPPRSSTYFYDTTGRFLIKHLNIEQLETNYLYDESTGQLLKETLPSNSGFPITKTLSYDKWGKNTAKFDYLGKGNYYNYSNYLNGGIQVIKTSDIGSEEKIIIDDLGREVISGGKNIDNTWSFVKTEYDIFSRKIKISEPFSNLTDTPTQFTTNTYNEYGQLIQNVSHTLKITNIAYSLNTSSVNDGFQTVTTWKDPLGKVSKVMDNGGEISYEYFANGNLKKTNANGSITTIEQDGWGRKTKLTDPSAGIYQYAYNGFGEITMEKTPNGQTNYLYDNFGKVSQKTIYGLNTNSKETYNYDTATKLLISLRFDDYQNNNYTTYNYGYDDYKRLNFKDESGFLAYYQQAVQFDTFGRPGKILYSAINTSDNKSSSKWVRNTYKNNFHWQIIDDNTNSVLWQVNQVNARGQLTSVNYGNNIAINQTYDQYGNIERSRFFNILTSPAVDVLNLYTTFEPLRGNLISRTNSLFNWTENFQYDSLDRLTHYTNGQGILTEQTYEDDGRIKENTLGKYIYSDTAKKFQNTAIEVNLKSQAYYENRMGIFNDSMEQQSGWPNYDPTVFSFDTSTSSNAKTGTTSLKINNQTSGEKVINSENWIAIDNAVDTEYTYSAWVKSDGTNPEAEVVLFMKTESELNYYTLLDQTTTTTTNQYSLIEKTVLVPASIKKLQIRLDNNATGILWFDDVRIRKTSENTPSERDLNISYNAWKSPYEIEETGVDKISFNYNIMNSRSSMFYGSMETDKMQRIYRKHYSVDGTMEIKHNTVTGAIEFVTYLGGDGYSAPVVYKTDGTSEEYLFLHRDYLGSIVAISDIAGNVVEKRLFDAWGEVIKIVDEQGNTINAFKILDRGYTGHEHLQSVGLIHMNGRLYDAKLHRFLQPDTNIQDPYNTQNHNRYSYVLNNPLKFNDPTGEFWNIVAAAVVGYVKGVISSGGEFNPLQWSSSTWTNAGLAAASFGASMLATDTANNFIDNYGNNANLEISSMNPIEEHGYANTNYGQMNMSISGLNNAMHQTDRNDTPNKYKRYFQNKLRQAETLYDNNKVGLRQFFDGAEIVGGTMEIAGFVAAPFTEGASLAISAEGAFISGFGTAGNMTMDVIEGKWDSFAWRGIQFGAGLGMGRALNHLPQTAGYLINTVKSFSETYVMPILEDSWNKFNTPQNKPIPVKTPNRLKL